MSPPSWLARLASANADSIDWFRVVLRGVGQIVFQGNALTGFFFLTGLAIGDPYIALGGFFGSLAGTCLAGEAWKDDEDWRAGLDGFNPALVGMAVPFKFAMFPGAWLVLITGALSATLLAKLLRRLPFPVYTSAFILVTWLIFAFGPTLGLETRPPASKAPAPESSGVSVLVDETLAGLSEIMLEGGALPGALILAGIAFSNRRHAVMVLIGALMGTLVALYCRYPREGIALGLFGYNSALAATAVFLWRPGLMTPLLAALVTAVVTVGFQDAVPLATLTAPFVLAVWLMMALGRWVEPWLIPPISDGGAMARETAQTRT